MDTKFLEEMIQTMSVSGYEEELQAKVIKHVEPFADKILRDATGNVISVINPGSANKIMLSGHIDEIGLVIVNITSDGYLKVVKAGGIRPVLYLGTHVQIKTKNGIVAGVVVTNSSLTSNANVKDTDLFIDIGATSKEDALKYVQVGDSVCAATDFRYLINNRMAARAMDDRIGAFIILEVLRRAKERGCTNGVYASTSVGEETTMRGAWWASQKIKPSVGIAVDVTFAVDHPGGDPNFGGDIKLDGGPSLCHSSIVSKVINNRLDELAVKLKMPIQHEVSTAYTHTDADKIHFSNDGVPVALVSIPLRYMHSSIEVLSLTDVENIIELLVEYVCTYE